MLQITDFRLESIKSNSQTHLWESQSRLEKDRDSKQMEELTDFSYSVWEKAENKGETDKRRTTATKNI